MMTNQSNTLLSNTIYYVPIEPLTERYTEQWYRLFPVEFKKHWDDVIVIDGQPLLADTIKVGTFLDINSTCHYKFSQLQQIAKLFNDGLVKNGDTFFFGDIEFWGLESIRLMADMNHVKVKIFGFLHAASYTIEDAFEIAAPYQKYTELGWVLACDKVFVGSNYHKQAFMERRASLCDTNTHKIINSKIIVTGNPLFKDEYKEYDVFDKKFQLVISNRFDWEKRPNLSLDFAWVLKNRYPDLKIIVCTSRKKFTSNKPWLVEYARALDRQSIIEIRDGLSKDQYHYLLAESRFMLTNTIEENYGYCVVEALHYMCMPIAKNAYSHPELLKHTPEVLFNDESEILDIFELLKNNKPQKERVEKNLTKYYNALQSMVECMKE